MKSMRSLSLCVVGIILLFISGCTQNQTGEKLSPLPVSLSKYIKDIDWQRNDFDTPGLPTNVKHIKYSGEKVWVEVFVRGDDLLYVRRKIFYRPDFFGPTDLKVQTLIMLILEKTTRRKVADFGSAFHRWMGQAVRDAVNGNEIDTRFDEKGLSIRLRTEGDDLILECARSTTMRALERFFAPSSQ